MPAVELDKLKLQSANLAGKISRPDLFLPMYRELLNYYSNRTFRPQTVPGRLKATPKLSCSAKSDLADRTGSFSPGKGSQPGTRSGSRHTIMEISQS